MAVKLGYRIEEYLAQNLVKVGTYEYETLLTWFEHGATA
jgi:hypothetical protein